MSLNLPLYKQIKNYLENLISQNQGNADYMLPSENQMALKFNSSRIPAKRALEELVKDGLIYRVQGKGSFIVPESGISPPSAEEKSICLFIPSVTYQFIHKIIEGIQAYLKTANLHLYIVLTQDDSKMEEQMINSALNKQHSGFLIFPGVYQMYNDSLLKLVLRRFPVVLVGRALPGLNVSSVTSNHYEQAYGATKYLIDRGHREIGFISEMASSSTSYSDRINGYKSCISEHFTNSFLHLTEIDFFEKSHLNTIDLNNNISNQIHHFFKSQPEITSLITSNMALKHIHTYMLANNINMNSLKIMVFDDPGYTLGYNVPSPIIIDQQPYEIGYQAAFQLHKHMKSNIPSENINIQYKILDYGELA